MELLTRLLARLRPRKLPGRNQPPPRSPQLPPDHFTTPLLRGRATFLKCEVIFSGLRALRRLWRLVTGPLPGAVDGWGERHRRSVC